MLATDVEHQHVLAHRELDAGHWESAREKFERLVEHERSPETLEGYGLALWFLGEMERGVELCQQASLAWRGRGSSGISSSYSSGRTRPRERS